MVIQVARPVADELIGGWSPTPLYQRLQGQVPNTSNPIGSSTNPQGDTFKVKLHGLAWPQLPGPVVLTVGLAGDGATPAVMVLLQGCQVIATTRVTPTASFQNYPLCLTDTQIAQISNYADLHVAVIAGDVSAPCCQSPLPALLYATFSNGTGPADCLDGAKVALTHVPGLDYWGGTLTACNGSTEVTLLCELPGPSAWATGLAGVASGVGIQSAWWCSPFAVTFPGISVTMNGGPVGTIDMTVTP